MHPTIRPDLIYVAAVNETPMPVASAKYAATQSGHFGIRARIALGTIHLAATTPRPNKLGRTFSQHV